MLHFINEDRLVARFWVELNLLGATEMARRAKVREQHVTDVKAGRRAPNIQLARWLGYERGWCRVRRPRNASAPPPTITPPGAS